MPTVTYSEFAGLRNDRPVERFEHGDLAVSANADIDNSGMLSRRDGYTLKTSGAKHSLWTDDTKTIGLYVAGTSLYALNTDLSGTSIMTGLTAGLHMSYHKINDSVYFSNGTQNGVLQNGVVRSWGLAIPVMIAAQATVGTMPAGRYQFTMTYLRNDGQESGAAQAQLIDVPDGSGLIFVMPVSTDSTVTQKNMYLSAPNGDVLFQALTLPNTQTSITYQGDASELISPLMTQFMGPPPAGQLVTYYRGHSYVATGDKIYPSEPSWYELFDLRKYIALDGRVTMLAPVEDKENSVDTANYSGFFVSTDHSLGIIVGMDKFVYVPKVDYSAIEGELTYVDGSLYADNSIGARLLPLFMTTQGLCVGMPSMEIKNLTRTRYSFTTAGRGAMLFMPGSNKLIATSIY